MQQGTIKLFILILVALGLIGGLYVYTQRGGDLYKTQQGTEVLSEDAVIEDVAMVDKEKMMAAEEMMVMMKDDADTLTGSLADVSGGDSTGVAYVLRKDGMLYHSVEASMPDPEAGSVYEGWLVKKTPTLQFFSTGVMEKMGDMYTLSYMSENEYPGYDFVVITLETEVDATPEAHILEGTVQ